MRLGGSARRHSHRARPPPIPTADTPIADAIVAAGGHAEPPPWLVPAALAFWGLLSGLWWLALPLALLAALPAWRGWRFELALQERRRVADLCNVMIVLAAAWLILNQPRLGTALILLIQWLPGLLFPLLAVQLFGQRGGIELSVLFLSLRRGNGGSRPGGEALFDLRSSYVLLCVIAASMIPPETALYLPALALLAAAALWPRGATAGRQRLFAGTLVVVLVIALGMAAGLRAGHAEVERIVVRWMEQWLGTTMDPYRATTAIGDVGRLKGSDRILLRVYPRAPIDGGLLLQSASYDRWFDGTWFTTGSLFEPLPDADGRRTLLADADAAAGPGERIVMLLRAPEGLLPLPAHAAVVTGLPGKELHRNGFGTVRYRAGSNEPLLNYRVRAIAPGAAPPPEAPPTTAELRLVGREQAAVAAFAESLGLAELPPEAALRRLQEHFAQAFRYTLTLPEAPDGVAPLAHFLTTARAGHCEYFATAAALTLRAAGIPTRYARGWSVQEFSPLEDAWIARDSHAHAWVLAYIDGRWRAFDPTPPDWGAFEAARRPWTQGMADYLAWLRLSISGAAQEDRGERNWLLLPLAALVLILAWRILRRARRGRGRAALPVAAVRQESPFAALEQAAARHGHGRRPGETLLEWAGRLGAERVDAATGLAEAVRLYYRSRFDPAGLDAASRERLAARIADCRQRWRGAPVARSR
ncbi:transglutaminase domain-containing protein [Thiohalocapsa sp. ML1]|uniref:DUF4129 domain-containing transglutaminase family protein n=1 Tax=Thiohalocapsa sp. ML1 TaxID=1431688 RepID=UPI0007321DE3|nr:transglutaminase domain-containing protein [Thiohalocapsa sp. ML1]